MKGLIALGLFTTLQIGMACEANLQEGYGEWKHLGQSGFQATASIRTAQSAASNQTPALSAVLAEAKILLLKKIPSALKVHPQGLSGVVVLNQCIRDQRAWAQVWVSAESATAAMSLKQMLQQSLQEHPTPQTSTGSASSTPMQ
jgi:hypothetical protein